MNSSNNPKVQAKTPGDILAFTLIVQRPFINIHDSQMATNGMTNGHGISWSFEVERNVQCSFPESETGHSKALSLDGRFDPDNILEKKKI